MERVVVDAEFANKNYSAYVPDLPGCITTGKSLDEIETNIKDAIDGHLEVSIEFGDKIPEVFEREYKLVFRLDVSAMLNEYSAIFTKAALSRITGINERQLWNYAAGVSKPRKKQMERIEKGLHRLGKELLSLELV